MTEAAGTGIFDVAALAAALPDSAGTLLVDTYLTDREAASARVFRVYRPTPPHYHATCDEYLYCLSGRGTFWMRDPAAVTAFGPGQLLFFEKGKRRLNDLGVADIISVPRIRGGYPAEKPPEVSEVLITQSSEPGELVVDPFMGSGSVGVAAARQQRRFAGNDLNPEAVRITGQRLAAFGETRGLEGLPPHEPTTLLEVLDSGR